MAFKGTNGVTVTIDYEDQGELLHALPLYATGTQKLAPSGTSGMALYSQSTSIDACVLDRETDPFIGSWTVDTSGACLLSMTGSPFHDTTCNAYLIRRSAMKRDFHTTMEDYAKKYPQGLSDLAFGLFDSQGHLKRKYLDDNVKKERGSWGEELNEGALLYFHQVVVQKASYLKELTRNFVHDMLEKVNQSDKNAFAIVAPGSLNMEVGRECQSSTIKQEPDAIEARDSDTAIHFWKSIGFRRIGSSDWFAFPGVRDHLNQYQRCPMNVVKYIPPILNNDRSPKDKVESLFKKVIDSIKKSESDEKFLEILKEAFKNVASNDPLWESRDGVGNTVLHLAAMCSYSKSAAWLVAQDHDLISLRDNEGDTPLESLEFCLEEIRVKRNVYGDTCHGPNQFKGFEDRDTTCLAVLKGMPNPSLVEKLRLKYGCTCGQCVGGFLSPRMRSRCRYIITSQCSDALEIARDAGESFPDANPLLVSHVSHDIKMWMRMSEKMCKGFVEVLLCLCACLDEGQIANEQTVMAYASNPLAKHFLENDGTVTMAGSCAFNLAANLDPVAGLRGAFSKVAMDDYLKKLPTCRNDFEFGLVSGMCGYNRDGFLSDMYESRR